MGKLSSRDRKLAHVAGQNVSNVENRNFAPFSASASQTILRGPLPVVPTTGMLTVADTVYFTYLGYTQKQLVVDYVKFCVTVAGAGDTQVAEVALCSSTAAPAGAAATLTVLAVDDTLSDLTGTGLLGNTTAMAYTVSPCVHLWAAARFDMAGTPTQPTLLGVNLDLSGGFVQAKTSHTAVLSVGESIDASLIAYGVAATAIAPLLMAQVKA